MSLWSWLLAPLSRKPSSRPHKTRFSVRPRLEGLEERVVPTQFMVTTTADSGLGSLRQAIFSSNATFGPNVISFDVNGGGAQVISPLTPLPTITSAVFIDGNTQPGGMLPLIELNGSLAGAGPTD